MITTIKHLCIFLGLLVLLGTTPVQAQLELPDPTRPANFLVQVNSAELPLADDFKLNSVLISSQRQVAIINEKSVEVGDLVNGATVRKIAKNWVELDKQGRHFSLSLIERDFKQRK